MNTRGWIDELSIEQRNAVQSILWRMEELAACLATGSLNGKITYNLFTPGRDVRATALQSAKASALRRYRASVNMMGLDPDAAYATASEAAFWREDGEPDDQVLAILEAWHRPISAIHGSAKPQMIRKVRRRQRTHYDQDHTLQ